MLRYSRLTTSWFQVRTKGSDMRVLGSQSSHLTLRKRAYYPSGLFPRTLSWTWAVNFLEMSVSHGKQTSIPTWRHHRQSTEHWWVKVLAFVCVRVCVLATNQWRTLWTPAPVWQLCRRSSSPAPQWNACSSLWRDRQELHISKYRTIISNIFYMKLNPEELLISLWNSTVVKWHDDTHCDEWKRI